ncbi:PH domain-containing protein [Virgibacillus ndiopensis]|uniref:PH domain-containing protein n=1 Tax=Virgibacillus ndiopensis TaxID=2004408 RepID=UPI000C081B40|nr:PH domain-containing protein [Virgibacillus ndiopensis]
MKKDKRHYKEFKKIVHSDEHHHFYFTAWMNHKRGILALTDKRLVYVRNSFLSGVTVRDFLIKDIRSFQYHINKHYANTLYINYSGKNTEINAATTRETIEELKEIIERANRSKINPSETDTNANVTTLTQLNQLAKLKEQGILTEAEIQEQKKKILKNN